MCSYASKRLLLISIASFKASPVTSLFFRRSEPARSHSVIFP